MRSVLLLILFLVLSCQTDQKQTRVKEKSVEKEAIDKVFLGAYQGIIPCADCDGIKTRIHLYEENQFELKMKYIGKSDSIYQYSGSYYFEEDTNKLSIENKALAFQFKLNREYLQVLSRDGHEIKADLSHRYVLKKQ